MKYTTDIKLTIINGDQESVHEFKDETIETSRASDLWIENAREENSTFLETLIECFRTDKRVGKKASSFRIETSQPTQIESSKEYYIEEVRTNDEQNVTLKWF